MRNDEILSDFSVFACKIVKYFVIISSELGTLVIRLGL